VLAGVGNLGRGLLRILQQKTQVLSARHGLQFTLVAAVDSSGGVVDNAGLDMDQVLKLKEIGKGVASYPKDGQKGLTTLDALAKADADLLVELSPTSLEHGEPGLSAITWALSHGIDVVTANKGPLVLAYPRLTALAAENRRKLFFSGTVAGGLPTVNIGQRDLIAARILRVEGIFNATTNYILTRMEAGLPFEQALTEAQKAGAAEADPTLDIDGWDAANKLVIVANSALGMPATLKDVSVQGIRGITREQLLAAKERGYAIKLLATAEPAPANPATPAKNAGRSSGNAGRTASAGRGSRPERGWSTEGETYRLSVKPTELPLDHPMAGLTKWQMGVVYTTDINGTIIAIIEEEGTMATVGAVLRDMVNLVTSRA
jgi:homoserine dehydrogenase